MHKKMFSFEPPESKLSSLKIFALTSTIRNTQTVIARLDRAIQQAAYVWIPRSPHKAGAGKPGYDGLYVVLSSNGIYRA